MGDSVEIHAGRGISRRRAVGLGILGASFVGLYWGTIVEMVRWWYEDPNFSHGFIIPFISGWFVWQQRERIEKTVSEPHNGGLIVVMGGLMLFLFGRLSGEYYSQRLSMIIVVAGAIIFCLGWEVFRKVLFPVAFLVFMIPVPYLIYNSFAFPLKIMVSKFSVFFLSAIGLPVLREGNIISFANTSLEVADACSGIRSIISLLALAAAIGHISLRGNVKRVVVFIAAVPIAIFVNSLRVIGTGILASRYGPKVAQGFFHEFAGLIIFSVAVVLLIMIVMIMSKFGGKRGENEK